MVDGRIEVVNIAQEIVGGTFRIFSQDLPDHPHVGVGTASFHPSVGIRGEGSRKIILHLIEHRPMLDMIREREHPDKTFFRLMDGHETIRGGHGSPDKSGGKFFNSIENLHLCTMNNQGLLALAQLILPSEILSNFEVVRVEEEASLIRIYLDESVKAEYKENPEIESKGFCEAVTIRDFPIRDKGVDLIVRRRKWYDKQNNRYFSDSYDLKAEETRYSKEFAAFLKGVYGDDSYDLPFA